jgi:hypothetical protein
MCGNRKKRQAYDHFSYIKRDELTKRLQETKQSNFKIFYWNSSVLEVAA